MYFKYEIGQEVVVKLSGKTGKVKTRSFTAFDNGKLTLETVNYDVYFGDKTYYAYKFKEEDLTPTEEFEKLEHHDEVHKVLIDIQLSKGDLDFARRLEDERKQNN